MKSILKILILLATAIAIIGCQDTNNGSQSTAVTQTKVRVHGSTSMEALTNGVAEVIKEEYPHILLEPQFTGSSAGIESLLSGTCEIATVSRYLKDTEKEQGIVENIVAIDGIIMVTDTNNTIANITLQQIQDIYTGKIRNWKEVGGPNQPIVVLGREAGSGTRTAFEELIEAEYQCEYAQEINEAGAVVAKVSGIPGAIGYVSLDVLNDTVKPLQIEGVTPNITTIQDGTYILQRPLIMATNGTIEEQSKVVQEVFTFMKSESARQLIEEVGLVNPNE